MRCPFSLLSIAVGLGALVLACGRLRELSLRAPLEVRAFARSLERLLGSGDVLAAEQLCDRLSPAWGAWLARSVLHAQPAEAELALDEGVALLKLSAQRHLDAIRTLGRLALPLALGCAIVELGLGFQPESGTAIAPTAVQAALDCALRAIVTGAATAFFCQQSGAFLVRQARARLNEVRIVRDTLARRMSRTTR